MIDALERRLLLSRTWFVSPSGRDASAGTITSPFQTIQYAGRMAQPGDTVYIRQGTYHEAVTPFRSGTSGAPITYSAYANEGVAIDGADGVTGWVQDPNAFGVFSAPQGWDLGTGNNEVFFDGHVINDAAWPNTAVGAVAPATAVVSAVYTSAIGPGAYYSDTATIATSGLPGVPGTWNGATIHIGMGQDWVVQTGTVLNSGNGTLTYAYQHQTNYETPVAGNHFYLTGKFVGLDAPGEWYRDSSSGRLYLRSPGSDNPTNHLVEAKRRMYGFDLSNLSYINIRNIILFSCTINSTPTSSHLNISGLSAGYVSQQMLNPIGWINNAPTTGIILQGAYNVLQDSKIQYSSGNGVYLGGSNGIIQNCTIEFTDFSGVDEAGITVVGANHQILSNVIHDTGRDGILNSNTSHLLIQSNTLYNINSGNQTTDLGAIYDYGTDSHGTVIAYNTIYGAHSGGFGAGGIYLDNGSADYIVHDNKISSVDTPIKLNTPSFSNSVYNNTVNGVLVANSSSGGGSPAAHPGTYYGSQSTLSSLGTLGGFKSNALGINNAGQVVGLAQASASAPSFIFSNGAMAALDTFGTGWGQGNAINVYGQVAGSAYTLAGQQVAYLATNGYMKNLGTLPGDTASSAAAVNSKGQVVGVSFGNDAIGNAFVYSGGVMQRLGALGGSVSEAFGINDAGTVVGAATVAGDRDAHAFAWFGGTMTDLGTLGGASSYATAINKYGQIAGAAQTSSGYFNAFIYSGGAMHNIGTLPGFHNAVATGINASGDIVGYAYNGDTNVSHAFVYHKGKMIDLNYVVPGNQGWTMVIATEINDSGKIVGTDTCSDLRSRAYTLSLLNW